MSEEIDQIAATWHLAQAGDETDWHAFTDWLEADPRHREAYDAIALLDAQIDDARPTLNVLLPPLDAFPAPRRIVRFAALGASAMAVIAAVVTGLLYLPGTPAPIATAYRAPVGRVRTLRLPDGSVAALAPGSVLSVAPSRDIAMTLDGSAFFDVRHDPSHPLIVRAGSFEIRDVGTRFDVSVGGGMVRVAVAEGRVAINGRNVAGQVAVSAGQAMTLIGNGGAATVRPARAASIGQWRGGSLVYDDVPLGLVVADIARSTGQPVTIDQTVALHRFSGVIAPGSRNAMVATLSELTGLNTRMDGDAIRLGDGASR